MAKNSLDLDYKDNPDLSDLLSGKQPGDRVTIELELMVKSNDQAHFEGDVESVSVETEESEDETEDGSAEVDADSPVRAIISKSSKPPRSKAAAEASDTTEEEDDEDEEE